MNKTKKTLANAITQIISISVQSILILIATRVIIQYIGSDYNGLFSTATQLLVVLTLLEGGFTLASLVKLYEPYGNNDIALLNKYLSLTKKTFIKIGVGYLVVGTIISLAYAPFVKSPADYWVIVGVFLCSVGSSSFNVFFVSKIRLLYQVSQTEYIIYIIQTVINILMYSMEILVAFRYRNVVLAALCITVFQIVFGFVLAVDSKRRFKGIVYNKNTSEVEITGTKDVFYSNLCGFIYSSAPVLFVSTFVGTMYTSVYAVYNSVLSVITSAINAILIAPRNALGQIIHSNEKGRLFEVFSEYEYIASIVISVLCSTTYALIVPFVRLYTTGITDVNYIDGKLAILLVVNTVLQLLHIPSGTCIEVSANFKTIKRIQAIGAILILVFSTIGVIIGGLYGILIAKAITSLYLCVAEISFTRVEILKSNIKDFLKNTMINIVLGLLLGSVGFVVLFEVRLTIVKFVVLGMIVLLINTCLLLFANFVVSRKQLTAVLKRIKVVAK